MTQSDDAGRQSRAPRERVSTLIAAIRRINATLDLDTVLGEVVERARALTGAREGVIVTVDESSSSPATAATRPSREYALLHALSLNAGRVMPYDAPVRQVWGERERGGPNLVRVFVRKLRRKLGEDAERPVWIFNERVVGYRMPDPGER